MKLFNKQYLRGNVRAGGALIVALATMTIVASFGAAYLRLVTSASSRQSSEVATLKAFYIAEAGLAEAFHSVRIGRTGQVASIMTPAKFGGGLVWVDASQTKDDQIRLVSTGMWAGGRATLSYVLQPKELTLGIFSDEDLVIDQVIMVDGYDSDLGSYESQLEEDQSLPADMPQILAEFLFAPCSAGDGTNGCYMGYHQGCVGALNHSTTFGGAALGGGRDPAATEEPAGGSEQGGYGKFLIARDQGLELYINSMREHVDLLYDSYVEEAMGRGIPSGETLYPRPGIGFHMPNGGSLASNGNISFDTTNSELQEIYGEIVTGPSGELAGKERIVLSGEHRPRGLSIDLPEVTVPDLHMQGPVRHDSPLPMLIPSGLSGLKHVAVAADSELIIQGPATVVLGELILEPGALLTLDTRMGAVALYVTGSMHLQPGSETVTTGESPTDLSLQVAPIASFGGEAPIRLESASQFKGTIYSPDTDVYLGSDFEVFGGVVASKLSFGAGSRLHVDVAEYGGSPVPRIVSWRILELPAGKNALSLNPYTFVGRDPAEAPELAAATDLDRAVIDVDYVDSSGTVHNFIGRESEFDWSNVRSVLQITRDSYRELEPGAERRVINDKFGTALEVAKGPRQSLVELSEWAASASSDPQQIGKLRAALKKSLKDKAPFSEDEWGVIQSIGIMDQGTLNKLSAYDMRAGGAGQ
ncbi:MAG: hypothetical protein ACI87O_000806 [Planctomycetota bacterium]